MLILKGVRPLLSIFGAKGAKNWMAIIYTIFKTLRANEQLVGD